MANNHAGSIDRGKEIIRQFADVIKKFPQFQFAFKFQRRELNTFLHPDYANRIDISYIKRFKETQLSVDQLSELQQYSKSLGFLTICTPFDELSVDVVQNLKFDYIKIGSCSINDWTLLNKVATTNIPVIASIGGLDHPQISKVISFFSNRQIPFNLMYCVGLYPCENNQLSLNKLDSLKQQFPNIKFGFSTHEQPSNVDSVKATIAKGVEIFEKHVDIENVNSYSVTPEQFEKYLESAAITCEMCKVNESVPILEKEKIRTFQRGAFLAKSVKKDEKITRDDLFFAYPVVSSNQYSAFECSKYVSFIANSDILVNSPLDTNDAILVDNSSLIEEIRKKVRQILNNNSITYPSPSKMEISHHYGLDKFYEVGMCIITLINKEYCKKLLIVLPGQINPSHFHKNKTETFFILCGDAIIETDGKDNMMDKGDLVTINQEQIHSIQSINGCVIEELSSKSMPNDSYYIDETISKNNNRKTTIYV